MRNPSSRTQILDAVVDDRKEVVVTRPGRESVVVASLDEYEALKGMVALLRRPANAHRLIASIERLDAG